MAGIFGRFSNRARADLALVVVTAIWGSTFVLVKNALGEISTFLFLALRFSVAALALLLIYRKVIRFRQSRAALFAGALLFSAYVFQTAGLETTTPSKSAFLTGLSIPMVPLLSSLVYRSRPRIFEVAGIVLASIGMSFLTFPQGSFGMSKGDFLSFLCAVVFALHIVVVGHFAAVIGFETLASIQVATAAVLGWSSFWFAEPVRLNGSAAVASAVLITGLLATALAFSTQAWAQQYTPATRAALIFALEPVIAAFTSYLLYGEILPVRAVFGAVLILVGILTVELKRGTAETKES